MTKPNRPTTYQGPAYYRGRPSDVYRAATQRRDTSPVRVIPMRPVLPVAA